MQSIFKPFVITAQILLGTAVLALADAEHGVSISKLISESSVVVEGKIASIKSVPLKRVESSDEIGRSIKYVEITPSKLKKLDDKAKAQVVWRHSATLSDITAALTKDLQGAKPTVAVIEYETRTATSTDSYSGPLPKQGEIYTFFSKASIPKIDAEGVLTFSVQLPTGIAPSGCVSTLERGTDGKLKITEGTPKLLDSIKYLQEKGQIWQPRSE